MKLNLFTLVFITQYYIVLGSPLESTGSVLKRSPDPAVPYAHIRGPLVFKRYPYPNGDKDKVTDADSSHHSPTPSGRQTPESDSEPGSFLAKLSPMADNDKKANAIRAEAEKSVAKQQELHRKTSTSSFQVVDHPPAEAKAAKPKLKPGLIAGMFASLSQRKPRG